MMTTTHLLTLDPVTGASVRVPFDLDTGAIDWLRVKPYHEPPLCAPLPLRLRREMTCNVCQRVAQRAKVGHCKCGGWMKSR